MITRQDLINETLKIMTERRRRWKMVDKENDIFFTQDDNMRFRCIKGLNVITSVMTDAEYNTLYNRAITRLKAIRAIQTKLDLTPEK